MPGRSVADATRKAVQTTEKGVESLSKKAWSVMDAASEKRAPSQYLGDQAVRSVQGRE